MYACQALPCCNALSLHAHVGAAAQILQALTAKYGTAISPTQALTCVKDLSGHTAVSEVRHLCSSPVKALHTAPGRRCRQQQDGRKL